MSDENKYINIFELIQMNYEKGIVTQDPEALLMKYLNDNKDNYIKVRNILIEMEKTIGAVLNPLALSKLFYDYLRENHKSQNNIVQARTAAYVYSCLCNEFYISSKHRNMKTAFFVSETRWKRYMIGRKAIDNNLPLLKEMSLIDYYNFWTQPQNKKTRKRFYRINVPMLEILLTQSKKIKSNEWFDNEESKPKEIKKASDDWDEFDWDAHEYGLKDLD